MKVKSRKILQVGEVMLRLSLVEHGNEWSSVVIASDFESVCIKL